MLRLAVLVFALAAARAAIVEKSGVVSPIQKILNDDSSIRFGGEVFDSPAEGPIKRSLGGLDDSSSSDSYSSSVEDGYIQRRPDASETHLNNIVKRSTRRLLPSVRRGIVKRSLGVMENAGLGALAAAVSTFSGSVTSANVASGQAASGGIYPQNQYQGYPRPGYHRPGYQQGYHRPGYQQGYPRPGYQQYPDYQYQGNYPGGHSYPNRGSNLSSNVNNINLVNGRY